MIMDINSKKIEQKWQKYWQENNVFFTDLQNQNKPKKYVLAPFPYPSGSGLHIGHIRNYTIADVMARFYRMQGYNVLFPTGWDAFGLPAEQYAIQTGNHPAQFTTQNIKKFKQQLLKMGFSYDWSKEIDTSDPNYYHWTQWIFKQIYQQGLAEYKKTPVYWCEKLGTVLANEEIKNVEGKKVSERGNFPVVEKKIPQWSLKITQYANELLTGLKDLDWPPSIKSLQINWIGLSKGTIVNFPVVDKGLVVSVFTTRPDTIYGVAAIALSINHPLITKITLPENQKKITDFYDYWSDKKESKEITGEFTGSYCLNPLNNEKLPIWVANYVLPDYGTGSVMVCPNCSLIDKNFADQYVSFWYPKKVILEPLSKLEKNITGQFSWCYEEEINDNYKYINSPLLEGTTKQKEAVETINSYLERKKIGKRAECYHLKDWVFSRQRYWGEPIPIIHWENGQKEVLADENLPLKLPNLKDFSPSVQYYSPLQKATDWVNIEKNGLKGKRDVNVMPQWAGSCWYYIAFLLKNEMNNNPPSIKPK